MHSRDLQARRWYVSDADGRCFVVRVFGRGRHRQVTYIAERAPDAKHTVPVRSFAQRFRPEEG